MRTRSLITTGLWTQLPDTLLATTNIVPTKNTTAQQYSRCSTAGSRGADYEVDSRRSVVSPDSERPEARVTWSVEWPAKGAAAWGGGGGSSEAELNAVIRSLAPCPFVPGGDRATLWARPRSLRRNETLVWVNTVSIVLFSCKAEGLVRHKLW